MHPYTLPTPRTLHTDVACNELSQYFSPYFPYYIYIHDITHYNKTLETKGMHITHIYMGMKMRGPHGILNIARHCMTATHS